MRIGNMLTPKLVAGEAGTSTSCGIRKPRWTQNPEITDFIRFLSF